jgi:hypothetical protein
MPRTYSAPRAYAASRPYAVPRTYASPGLYAAQRGVARMGGPVRVAPGRFTTRVIGPRVIVGAPFRGFYRPYYAFRPRFSIGFGLFVGYPVAFPYYAYAYPYPYPYPYSYPYPAYGYPSYPPTSYPYPASDPNYPPQAPPQGSVGVAPGQQQFGGVSFEITPADAQIYVDDDYIGVAGDFTPTRQPLTLTPGRHHIELRASGYRTMTFDADIVAGQVIPYRGTLQR